MIYKILHLYLFFIFFICFSQNIFSEDLVNNLSVGEKEETLSGIVYSIKLKGKIPPDIIEQLKTYSLLEKLKKNLPGSITGLGKRADKDKKKFRKILAANGYLGATVSFRISAKEDHAVVKFSIKTGPQYQVLDIKMDPSDNPALFKNYGKDVLSDILDIKVFDVVKFEKILSSIKSLKRYLNENGYPNATVHTPTGYVDHEKKGLTLVYKMHTGVLTRIKSTKIIDVSDSEELFVRNRLIWKNGDIYSASMVDKTRGLLSSTQLISSIIVKLEPTDFRDCIIDEKENPVPQDVDIKLFIKKNYPRSIGVGLRYSLSEKLGGNFYWHHNNFLEKHHHLGVSFKYFKDYKRLKLEYDIYDFYMPLQELSSKIELLKEDNQLLYSGKVQYFSSIIKRPFKGIVDYHAGVGLIIENALLKQNNLFIDNSNFIDKHQILGFPMIVDINNIKNKKNPLSGMGISAELTPYIGKMVGTKNIMRLITKIVYFLPLSASPLGDPWFVLATRMRFGKLFVQDNIRPPLNKRFYSGGAESVRAYGQKKLSPYVFIKGLDKNNNPYPSDVAFIGGRSIVEFSSELRYRYNKDWGLSMFVDGAMVNAPFSKNGTFENIRFLWGPGFGVQYFTSFAPIKVDIALPMKIRKIPGTNKKIDSIVQFYISIGQEF